jgi:hypothetical protein
MKNKKYETILEMDDRQWEEFRNTKWLAYKAEVEKHTLPPPDWYMQSKEDYVEFLETKDLSKITVPKKQTSSFKEIIKNIMKSDDTLLKQWAVEDFSKED